jgi:hypothetical protein
MYTMNKTGKRRSRVAQRKSRKNKRSSLGRRKYKAGWLLGNNAQTPSIPSSPSISSDFSKPTTPQIDEFMNKYGIGNYNKAVFTGRVAGKNKPFTYVNIAKSDAGAGGQYVISGPKENVDAFFYIIETGNTPYGKADKYTFSSA